MLFNFMHFAGYGIYMDFMGVLSIYGLNLVDGAAVIFTIYRYTRKGEVAGLESFLVFGAISTRAGTRQEREGGSKPLEPLERLHIEPEVLKMLSAFGVSGQKNSGWRRWFAVGEHR